MPKKGFLSFLDIYTLPNNFMNPRIAIFLLVWDLVIGVAGFMIVEGFGIIDAIYMVIITVSTVGYTEVQGLSDSGKLFTSIYIVVSIGLFAYFFAVFSYYVVQGELFKFLHSNMIQNNIKKLKNHVILCGYGKYGREISMHFEKQDIPYVVIDTDAGRIESLQESDKKVLYLHDDATHDEVLQAANIDKAQALIAALGDDSDNLFIVLTARQLNPRLNIVSRARDPRSEKKLTLAGANRVVMPEQLGGFFMATLVTKPNAVEFFSFITNEYRTDIGFEEISYEDVPQVCKNKSIKDLNIRSRTGANIIGFKDYDSHYVVNPPPNTILRPGSSFIVLGSQQQLLVLKEYLKTVDL